MCIRDRGYRLKGTFSSSNHKPLDPLADPVVKRLLEVALNCNNAQLTEHKNHVSGDGDPTEIALLVMAYKAGLGTPLKRIREIPFDSERKRMSVVVQRDVYKRQALSLPAPPGVSYRRLKTR